MQNNFFNSETPTFARAQAYNFDTNDSVDLYDEIMNIAREIERCRASV